MSNKEIREILKGGDVSFHITNHKKYDGTQTTYRVTDSGRSIGNWIESMNVNKWGPTCVTLYSYDMLQTRTVGKIRYEDINLIEEPKVETITDY
jgi:hypothetical protein